MDSTVDYQRNIHNDHPIGQYEIDKNLQIYYLILKYANHFLSLDAKTPQTSRYFKKTMENPKHNNALVKLNAGDDDWFNDLNEETTGWRDNSILEFGTRPFNPDGTVDELFKAILILGKQYCQFPYFWVYSIDNGLKPFNALKGLFRSNTLIIELLQSIEASDDFNPEDYDYMKIGAFFSRLGTSEPRISSHNEISTLSRKSMGYCDYRIIKDGHEHDS